MNIKYIIILILIPHFIFSQCNYDIGDYDSNGLLDVVDIVAMVNFIIDNEFNSNNELFDLNFDNIFYVTDTARMWDGYRYSVRDKINTHQKKWIDSGLVFSKTDDIINAIKNNKFPSQVMFTMHPQRWSDNFFIWSKELLLQNMKNKIKKHFFVHE